MSVLTPSFYSNKHQGRRGFIIGSGPSLRNVLSSNFTFDVFAKEIIVAVNQSYKLGKPNYIVSLDPGFCGRNAGKFPREPSTRFVFPQWVNETPETNERRIRIRVQENCSDIPYTFSSVFPPLQNSGVLGIVIGYLLGLNPIYLLGFDGVKLGGKTHFHMDYGHWKLNDGQVHSFFKKHLAVVNILNDRGVTFYSCSPISLLNEVIPFKDITKIFV